MNYFSYASYAVNTNIKRFQNLLETSADETELSASTDPLVLEPHDRARPSEGTVRAAALQR
jgi:hypothetical protein